MSSNDPNQPAMGQPAGDQILCPNCNGGNPPGGVNCMWCGKPLSASQVSDAVSGTTTGEPATSVTYSPVPPVAAQETQPAAYQAPASSDYTQPAQTAYADPTPYSQPSPVVTAPPPAAKSGSGKRVLLIVGGVLLGLLLLCGILFGSLFAGVMGLTQPAADVGEQYMAALRDGNYDRAFELSTPSLQQEVGNAQALKDALDSKRPTKWSFSTRNIENDLATLEGSTTYEGDEAGVVEMELRKVGDNWRVSFINLR